MNDWLYRIMMTVLAVCIISQIVVIVLTPAPVVGCVNGLIMEQHKDLWVQRGWLPEHCVLIDKD